jgi:hypothetical protein
LDIPKFLYSKGLSNKISGIDVVANRLFGPQPKTSTYVCVWEIQLGGVKASLSASDARLLAAAGNFFRLNFVDIVNAPASEFVHPLDPDSKHEVVPF